MFQKRSSVIVVLVSTALALATIAAAHSAWPPPAPFGKYLVYTAAGVYDPSVPPAEGDLADWFHREVMGRDDAAFNAERGAADAYFQATFGSLYTRGSSTRSLCSPSRRQAMRGGSIAGPRNRRSRSSYWRRIREDWRFHQRTPGSSKTSNDKIAAEIAHQYLLAYEPGEHASDGALRPVSVRVPTLARAEVRTRRGYYATQDR